MEAYDLTARLHTLALLRDLLKQEVLARLLEFLDSLGAPPAAPMRRADLYCSFVAALYRRGGDLGLWLRQQVLESDNPAVRLRAAGEPLPEAMEAALMEELETLGRVSALTPAVLTGFEGAPGGLPGFAATPQDFAALYMERLAGAATVGYGIFAAWHMFTLGQGGTLRPVRNPDPQQLAELTGYEAERGRVVLNTRALLRGLPAANVLLYGDAGTGKSSTVKALANEYRADGLRLVEVRKDQLYAIPQLMDELAGNPLKFILFIDDLSFPADDGDFTALKAILEGNVSARPGNIVVYATSNRRHMVKERFADRAGGDVHRGDTLEEEASLAARFGLVVTFLRPDRALYAEIVLALADELGLAAERQALLARAEAHAIRSGGRSPRTARQFAEQVKAEEALM